MGSEEEAVCGAQEERHSYEERSALTKQFQVSQVGIATADSRLINNMGADAAAEGQERRDLHNNANDGSARSSRQHSPMRRNEDMTAQHDGTRRAGSLGNLHRASMRQGTRSPRPSRTPELSRSSFDNITRWSKAWQAEHTTGADQVELPLSTSSSLVSVSSEKETLGHSWSSLEQLELRPEAIPLPERSGRTSQEQPELHPEDISLPESSGRTSQQSQSRPEDVPLPESSGRTSPEQPELRPENIPLPERNDKKKKDDVDPESSLGWVRKKRRKKTRVPRVPAVAAEVADYRSKIRVLAHRLTNFENVDVITTRHSWSPRIVYYDHFRSGRDGQDYPYRRNEPWENHSSAPAFKDFRETLLNVSDDCMQRMVLVEDLTPSLIDLLGATFQIPPHVFEEHLDRSGYMKDLESGDGKTAWHTRSSTQGYSSVTWFRPVLPLVPVTSRFRSKLIRDRKPRVPCPFDGCQERGHNLRLNTQANIWRHQLDLCPEPGVYHKDSDTEYPVGWEERATIWARNYDDCQFIILFLDPLPIVSVDDEIRQHRREAPTLPNLYIRRQYKHPQPGVVLTQRRSQDDPVRAWVTTLPQTQVSPLPPPQLLSSLPVLPEVTEIPPQLVGSRASGPQPNPSDSFSPAALRRRATRPDMENGSIKSMEAVMNTQSSRRRKGVTIAPPPPAPSKSGPSANIMPPSLRDTEERSLSADTHGPFVPYHPVKARSSSSTWSDDALHMRAYIESLQIPRSTIDEFEYFFNQPTKGKETVHDPLRALFRAIHDDTHCLVDIVRISLQRIREGTLDEDLMQRRVSFWRGLLHSMSFNFEELEQRLRGFVHFADESENESTQSHILVRDTRQTLRDCMGLIDRTSRTLLAEMQIVDSRRSIAEAESVSKLTELAFVFIPLSFVASLFSMQIHELDGGVPLYTFALVAIGFVLIAYTVRLSIRSSRLIEHKNKMVQKMREESHLQHNDSIPTHTFLLWAGRSVSLTVFNSVKDIVTSATPFILVSAIVAAILSPIILLWLRNIDKGFSAVITVILLLLDSVLVSPLLFSDGGITSNPKAKWEEMKRNYRYNKKMSDKRKKKKRQKTMGIDPEVGEDDSSTDEEELWNKTGAPQFVARVPVS